MQPLRRAGRPPAGGGVSVSRLVPSGLSQSRFGLGADREPAGVEAEVEREPEPEPLGDLRQLRVEPEPAPGDGLDVPVVEVGAVDLAAVAELPEDRLERQERLVGLGVGARRRRRPSPR